MVASVAIPVVVFCWGAWVTYNNAVAHADEELEHVPPDLNLEDSLRAMEGRVYWH